MRAEEKEACSQIIIKVARRFMLVVDVSKSAAVI
jgi:hypothetical protein